MHNIISSLKRHYEKTSVIAKASMWFVLVTIIDKAISVLTQPVINRILSIEEVGVYGSYLSWRSIFAVLATFNLYCGVLEVLLTKEKENKRKIVSSLTLLSLLIAVVFFGVCLLCSGTVSTFVKLKPAYILIMAISIISEAVIQFWGVPKRFEYSYKDYSYLMVGLFFCKSILSVLLAYILEADRAFGRILGMTIPSAIAAIVLGTKIFSNVHIREVNSYWKVALQFNIPLIPHYLSSILLASSDKLMIQKMCGDKDVGLYTVAYSYAGLTLIVFQALNNAYSPYALKVIKDGNVDGLRRETNMLVTLSVAFSAVLILFAPEGLLLLGGNSYLTTVHLIPILISGIFFSSFYLIFSNVEFVYEKTKYVFPITLLGASVNIALNYFCLPIWGYEVAAYTTLLGYVIIAIAHYLVSWKLSEKPYFDMRTICVEMIALCVICVLAQYLYQVTWAIRYTVIVGGIVLFFIWIVKNKKRILSLFKKA